MCVRRPFRLGSKFPFTSLLRSYSTCMVVPTQIHLNTWQVIHNFMIKWAKVGCKPLMKTLHLVLSLKWGLSIRNIVYASYRKMTLAPLLLNTLYRW